MKASMEFADAALYPVMPSFMISCAISTVSRGHCRLHDRILKNELPPGTGLGKTEIATGIGLSRQPVQEKFIRLAAEGLDADCKHPSRLFHRLRGH